MTKRTHNRFHEGDRVRIKRENYLSPLIRGKRGTVMDFFLQTGVYKIKIDNNPNPAILKVSELELLEE